VNNSIRGNAAKLKTFILIKTDPSRQKKKEGKTFKKTSKVKPENDFKVKNFQRIFFNEISGTATQLDAQKNDQHRPERNEINLN